MNDWYSGNLTAKFSAPFDEKQSKREQTFLYRYILTDIEITDCQLADGFVPQEQNYQLGTQKEVLVHYDGLTKRTTIYSLHLLDCELAQTFSEGREYFGTLKGRAYFQHAPKIVEKQVENKVEVEETAVPKLEEAKAPRHFLPNAQERTGCLPGFLRGGGCIGFNGCLPRLGCGCLPFVALFFTALLLLAVLNQLRQLNILERDWWEEGKKIVEEKTYSGDEQQGIKGDTLFLKNREVFFSVWDWNVEDGDIIDIELNNGVIAEKLFLKKKPKSYPLFFETGSKLRFIPINDGRGKVRGISLGVKLIDGDFSFTDNIVLNDAPKTFYIKIVE